jgi:hypothetical protein
MIQSGVETHRRIHLNALVAAGQPLKLDFETGTLKDWVAKGTAFAKQPVRDDPTTCKRSSPLQFMPVSDFARQRIPTLVDTLASLKYNRSMRMVIARKLLSNLF